MKIQEDRDGRTQGKRGEQRLSQRAAASVPARIACIYEGEDDRLCLFETHDGHLIAVDASRLV